MARRFRVKMRKGINVPRVTAKVASVVLALYVGGTILTEIGTVMYNTTSPYYKGLTLIGWEVSDAGLITSTSGTGILAVVGIVGVASIIMEFVNFRMG